MVKHPQREYLRLQTISSGMTAHESLQQRGSDDPPPATPPKATLFCPDCGRDAPVDGSWEERQRTYGVAVHCPRCETRLTLRPQYADDVTDLVHGD
jgi:DNA-directed RNA polymerase subunit RPC12/RpoP